MDIWKAVKQIWFGELPTKARVATVTTAAFLVVTLLTLNVEKWAEDRGYDRLYKQAPDWLASLWIHVTGAFGFGFVLGAIAFAFWDPVLRWWRKGSLPPISAPTISGLYVGEMIADPSKLETEGVIEISIRCYNSTGRDVWLHRVSGTIIVNRAAESTTEVGRLPQALLLDNRGPTEHLPSGKEFMAVLEQRVPKNIAEMILSLTGNDSIQFLLEDLDVVACAHDDPTLTTRLPLWDGLTLRRGRSDQLRSGRVTVARMGPISLKLM